MKTLIVLACLAGLAFGGWTATASVYRRAHCIELFGHWVAVDRTASLFCEGVSQ